MPDDEPVPIKWYQLLCEAARAVGRQEGDDAWNRQRALFALAQSMKDAGDPNVDWDDVAELLKGRIMAGSITTSKIYVGSTASPVPGPSTSRHWGVLPKPPATRTTGRRPTVGDTYYNGMDGKTYLYSGPGTGWLEVTTT